MDKRENAFERSNSTKDSPVSFLDSVIDASNRKHSSKPATNGGGILSYSMQQIQVGDYVVMLPGDLVGMVIERKTWKDLGSSIVDGRVDTQVVKMKKMQEQTGCLIYFIIEGPFSYDDETKVGGAHGLKFSQLHSKIRHNMHRGVPYIQTKDANATIVMIAKLARDVITLHARGDLKLTPTNITGGMTTTMNTIAKKGDSDILFDVWKAIPGVTINSAPILANKYILSDIFGATTERLAALQAEISELTYPSGARIGKQAEKITSNFTDDNYYNVSLLCLQAIKGMGKAAEAVLAEISLYDLCNGFIGEDDLAEITVGGRKLGKDKIQKILTLFAQRSVDLMNQPNSNQSG